MLFRLKEFRETQGLFQSDMAALLELNQSSVSRMELKPASNLTAPQYKRLCDQFGKETIDEYIEVEDAEKEGHRVLVAGNKNVGNGSQDNRVSVGDALTMQVIKEQSQAMAEIMRKQAEQTDRLLDILAKITDK